MMVRIKTIVLSLREKATRDDRMGLVKTIRLAANGIFVSGPQRMYI